MHANQNLTAFNHRPIAVGKWKHGEGEQGHIIFFFFFTLRHCENTKFYFVYAITPDPEIHIFLLPLIISCKPCAAVI